MRRGMTAFWAIALSATAFVSTANPVHGAEPLTDPSKACQRLGELVAERDPGQAVDALVEMSDGKLNRGQGAVAIGQIDALRAAFGDLHLVDFMAERIYGERVRRYWYVLLFEESSRPISTANS